MTDGRGPLAGIRVLDAATLFAGPLIATMLGDFGADVIKIEHPQRGDPVRGHGYAKDGQPLWWKVIGRNKRCITLNLGDPDGAALFRRLAATADVVVENFRPGTMERWGLGWDVLHQLNPRLVMVRVTGFGQDGPYARRPAFGTLMEAMTGFAHITGEPDGPPTLPPFGLADGVCAMAGTWATAFALYERDTRSGEGQMIDMAIYEPLLTVLGAQPTVFDQLGIIQQRTGNRTANNAPRNTYKTRDGRWVALSTSADTIAERVMRLVGHPEVVEEPWFRTGRGRAEHGDLLDRMVGEWIAAHDFAEVMERFEAVEAAVAPIYDVRDVLEDPHFRHRQSIVTVEDPVLGPIRMQNVLARLSATPGRIRWPGRDRGADNLAVFHDELGLTTEEVAALARRGVI
ncbi:MAG: CoA transferase [Actinomycetia bacterium]|nr:CoA transferase [Actinomycetes bacterium]